MVTSTISLGAFSIISMVLGLANTVIVTRYFSQDVFGAYTLVLVVVTFLFQISTFGLELSISRFIAGADTEEKKIRFISTAVILRMGMVFLALLLAWFGQPLLKKLFGDSLVPELFAYVPLLFLLESLRSLLRAILQGFLLFFKMGVADLLASLVNFFLLLVLVFVVKGNINTLILIKALSSLVSCIYAYISIPIKKRIAFQWDIFKELAVFGFPLQLNNIMSFVFMRIDTLIIAAMMGPAEIAVYEVARRIPDTLRQLFDPFRSVYFPFLSKKYLQGELDTAATLVNESNRIVTFFTTLGCAISFLFGKEIILLLFSDKYLDSVFVFKLLMFSLCVSLIGNILGTALVAVGESSKIPMINMVQFTASIVGNLVLIPQLKVIGAAITSVVGPILTNPLNAFYLRKHLIVRISAYQKPVIILIVWTGLAYLLNPQNFLLRVGFVGIFLAACFLFSVITIKDIKMLIQSTGIESWLPRRWLGLRGSKP
jgi:O-antigen/teichoic acid export membrane protein